MLRFNFFIRVLMLRYDLSNVHTLHDIAIKDVDFEGRGCMVRPLILVEMMYVSVIIMLFWKQVIQ